MPNELSEKQSTMGLSDGPREKADGNRKCPHCEALLQDNIGYDACPVCGKHLKSSSYRVISVGEDPWAGALPADDERMWGQQAMPGQQPQPVPAQPGVDPLQQPFNMAPGAPVPGAPAAPVPGAPVAPGGMVDPDGPLQGSGPGEPYSEYEFDENQQIVPTNRASKYRVVALGEMQQPGGVGATQTTGLVDGDPQSDDDPAAAGISTDAGQNSFEQNVALETWVNFAVDMLNRGKQETEVLSQLAHDGCPDPKGVLQRALEQPEDQPLPNEGAEDPFDVPFKNEQTSQEESVSHQPPVVETTASWQPDWRRIERNSSDANELGGPIGEPADSTAPKDPDQDNVFDVEKPSGDDQADLFDVDEPKDTDTHVAPIEFKKEVGTQETKDVHKSNRVRIAGTSWKGTVIEEWEDLWGEKKVRVALADGGSIDVDPSRVIPDDPTQMEHPVTEIEKFISNLPAVEATRPSIMARLANLEIIRRAVRANVSKVGFSDQLKLERIDLAAQEETRDLREIMPHVRNEFDRNYLANLPRYQSGDGTQAQDPEFNEKIAEKAAIFVEEMAPETRADKRALAGAAAHYAAANNGNVPEFVKAVMSQFQEDAEAYEHQHALNAIEHERRTQGVDGPVDTVRDNWVKCKNCGGEDFPGGICKDCGTPA